MSEIKSLSQRLPVDARYSIEIEDGITYFLFPDIDHFRKIFDKNSDGIAIDIIHKDQFQCGIEAHFIDSWQNKEDEDLAGI